jgi:hypothetical protein
MAKQTITVTAEHITSGTRIWTGTSPIALALAESYPGIPVDVYSNWMHLCGAAGGCQDATLPAAAEDFMHAYNSGEEVTPIEFAVYWERAEDEEG